MLNIIKQLRTQTGAGVSDCKKALDEAGRDFNRAIEILREKGQKMAITKQAREIKEGLIEAYIHAGGKVGVIIELGCETDFVARHEEFKALAHEIAMQIAAINPLYVSPEDVPEEIIEKEREIIKKGLPHRFKESSQSIQRSSLSSKGGSEITKGQRVSSPKKSEDIVEKIIQGKIEKYYQEACLLKQPFIKDDKRRVEELIAEKIAKLGENIQVRRFVRYAL